MQCPEELHGISDTDRFILIVDTKLVIFKPGTLSSRKIKLPLPAA